MSTVLFSRCRTLVAAAAVAATVWLGASGAAHADKPHFTNFPGPKVTITAKPGAKAWVAVPIAMSWDSLKICQYDFVRTDKNEGVCRFISENIYVPSPFILAATPAKGLAKGDAVLVSTYVTNAYGRVVGVKGDRATVAFYFGGRADKKDVTLTEVLPLKGALTFGQPVAYLADGEWKSGQLIHSDGKRSWVIGFAGKPAQVATADVRPIKPQVFKVGDKVWAAWVSGFKPATVRAVVDGGVGYRIVYQGETKPQEKTWAEITSPLQ